MRNGCMILRASLVAVLMLATLGADSVWAEGFAGDYTIGGWIRADYGSGDRYPKEDGEDTLGVSQAALLGKWKYENIEAVLLLGGTNLTANDSDGDGDFGIKDAFIIWKDIGGTGFRLTAGVQPLFYGLKSNGFPGDRSLQPSLEFGGAGGFAVSQQAGPSVMLHYDAGDTFTITAGVFDTSSSTASYFEQTGLGGIDGSSLDRNYMVQVETKPHRGETGLYWFAGYLGRYIGDATDATKPILDFGVGYRARRFDISFEAMRLDKRFLGTLDDEMYGIAELTLYPKAGLSLYLDYAMAEESEIETLRAGLKYQIASPLTFMVEYSEDEFGLGLGTVSSGDVRLEITF